MLKEASLHSNQL